MIYSLFSQNSSRYGIQYQFDCSILLNSGLQCLICTEFLPTMHQIYFLCHSGKIHGIAQCSISAANHCNGFIFIECSVTRCTVGNALQCSAWHVQSAIRCSGSTENRAALQWFSLFTENSKALCGLFDVVYFHIFKLCTQLLCMFPKLFAQRIAINARKPRIIIYLFTDCNLSAAQIIFFQYHCCQLCPTSIDGSG